MVIKQYFDIKYPFTNDCIEKYELDLNKSRKEMITSQILHLIFTPKGQRLRLPDYGTDLIRYIFEPNDKSTWENVKNEIFSAVTHWITYRLLRLKAVMIFMSGLTIRSLKETMNIRTASLLRFKALKTTWHLII